VSAGQSGRDLGRIIHDPAYATPICEGCAQLNRQPAMTKTTALRVARGHVARTGHTVTIYIQHWQRVHPAGG
jgi:hypothetical protein